jgi:hypothetical protein
MTHPIPAATAAPVTQPQLPSITASALLESRLLLARTRRVVAALLTRG